MGQGKSRMDQLAQTSSKSGPSSRAQMMTASDFTNQLEKLQKELQKLWLKEDKVGCMRIAI